jgi:hypothetical protein
MSELFGSLACDLRDRRFLPILVLLGVALIASLAFALLSGSGSATSPASAPGAAASAPTGATGAVAITKAPESASSQAVAETTDGSSRHGSGAPRDPFKPLPSSQAGSRSAPAQKASSTPGATKSASGSSPSSSESHASNGGGTAPSPSEPSAPAKPRVYIHYHVTAQFGVVPPAAEGAPPQPAQLKTFPNMALDEALPSKHEPQLVFLGVNLKTGDEAVFGLTGEAILKGAAVCKPSPSQCQAIELQADQTETLEVVGATGQASTYELKLVAIEKTAGSAAAASAHAASVAAAKVDRNDALRESGLRFSPTGGGLVFVGRRAFGAHAARRR